MTRGLAIETSGRIGSLAVVEDGRVLTEDTFPHGLKHAAEIVVRIDRLCRDRGWTPADLRDVYVSAGPGSFTGLRVGVTVAKTLGFATGARVTLVPTVDVLARNAPAGWRHAIVVLDAKRDQIFTGSFASADGTPSPIEPAHLDTLAAMLARAPRPVHLIGEGIPYHEKFILPSDAGVIVTPAESWRARAAVVAEVGVEMAARGLATTSLDQLAPLYIRKPEAEEKWEERNAGSRE